MYVDGYLVAVSAANKEIYRELATKAGHVFKREGALRDAGMQAAMDDLHAMMPTDVQLFNG